MQPISAVRSRHFTYARVLVDVCLASSDSIWQDQQLQRACPILAVWLPISRVAGTDTGLTASDNPLIQDEVDGCLLGGNTLCTEHRVPEVTCVRSWDQEGWRCQWRHTSNSPCWQPASLTSKLAWIHIEHRRTTTIGPTTITTTITIIIIIIFIFKCPSYTQFPWAEKLSKA